MKIEMGESLLYSWLRHVKECQIVQLNWKVSPNWELRNEDRLLEIMNEVGLFFEKKYGYNVFKNNSLKQLIAQAEVDVLGISIDGSDENIYAIDVAFHEAGLNYGSKDETISRIIKKCVRTAICIYGYMGKNRAEIIFASPKINNAVMVELEQVIDELNNLMMTLDFKFPSRLIANEDFNIKILDPILIASDGISDTSELFLRSYQMYKIFDNSTTNSYKKSYTSKLKNITVETSLTDETLKELKIGKLVQTTMKKLFDKEIISENEIINMTDYMYSKKAFNANIPVLKELLDGDDIDKAKRDHNNYPRYYSYIFTIYGKKYLLSSQWVEHLHRKHYEKWLSDKL